MPSQFSVAPRSTIRTTCAFISIFATLLLTAGTASAQWRVTPTISVGVNHDDNLDLTSISALEASAAGWSVEAEALFSYETALSEFSLTPGLRANRYDGLSALDSEEGFLDFNYRHRGQLSRFQIRGSYADEAVRTADRANVDFDAEDPLEIPADDTGGILGTENRQSLRLVPNWSYRVGDRSTIRLGARLLDVSYDEVMGSLLTDYTQSTGQVTFDHDLSERNRIGLSAYYRKNDFDVTGDGDVTGSGLQFTYRRTLSETTVFDIKLGVDSTEDTNGIDQNSTIGEISLVRNFETYRVLASYRRSVEASGVALLALRDSLNLNLSRDLSEKLSLGAGVRAYQTSGLSGAATTFDERDYLQIGGLLSWRWTRAVTIDFDYYHTNVDRELAASTASSNEFNLWFRYSPTL